MARPDAWSQYGGRTKREFYETLYGSMISERSSFDAHWREIADWIYPRRTRFTPSDRNKGDRRNQNIVVGTAKMAHRTLRSGMHAGLTSPLRPWFSLGTPDPDLATYGPVKSWLHVATQRMQALFAGTNIYNTFPQTYGDCGLFGTAAMALLEDDADLFRAYSYPNGSYVVGLDRRGRPNQFMREYEFTVYQVVQEFGGEGGSAAVPGRPIVWAQISDTVRALWDNGQYTSPVQILWAIAPNPQWVPGRLSNQSMQFSSCHIERTSASAGSGSNPRILRESGFHEFPVMVPRWEVTSAEDCYGTDCPGMTSLGDVKSLQLGHRTKAKAIAKIVSPALVGPSALRTQQTSSTPNSITYLDVRDGMQGLRPVHEVRASVKELSEDLWEYRDNINEAFYKNLFLMIAQSDQRVGGGPMTAREVDERAQEKLLGLGPVVELLGDELHTPAIDRVFAIMMRRGYLPVPPPEIQGIRLKVEYLSIMAQAQKLVGVVGQDRFLSTLVPLAEVFPGVRHKVRIFKIIDAYADMLGQDPATVVPTEEAEAAQAQEAQAAQAAQAAQTAKAAGEGARAASQATLPDATSALSRMLDSQGGA